MSKLDHLTRIIYHEKQQSGSMLCAQHALNNLLQGNYFTAPDLSEIACNLDSLEQSYNDEERGPSSNMDDTGYFSVQVLENALSVWSLSLVRWRGEQMRSYQDHPHTQHAFILNSHEHWYTLRRFGLEDDESGHWFDLNSLLPAPKWVGRLYLGMVLQQAEADGYSVFVIKSITPSNSLPRTDVDQVAATIPEDQLQLPLDTQGREAAFAEGLEDEDWELQAALHASLGGAVAEVPAQPPQLLRGPIPLPESGPPSGSGSGVLSPATQSTSLPLAPPAPSEDDASQLAAASRERGRKMLEQMTAEQHEAQQELWREGNRPVRRSQDDGYEEMLRRAIAESEALAKAEGHHEPDSSDDNGGDIDVDVPSSAPRVPPLPKEERVYDDDDAELQAALKASLEQMPSGWVPPAESTSAPSSSAATQPPTSRSLSATKTNITTDELSEDGPDQFLFDQPAQEVDHEEMRRRRLARFGG
ncbi:Josephin-domain-containing protein [Marasmius fiardii PR-910]|nr:Josephin-domain-containing protein [Marasmius fiardii PR-910]